MEQPHSLTELLDRIAEAVDGEKGEEHVTLDAVLDRVGRRSFGTLLLLAGLITVAPVVGDIPGVPTMMGIFVILISGQLLLGRDSLWLPGWLLRRSVRPDWLEKAVEWLRRPARWIDQVTRPRLRILVRDRGARVIGVACLVIGIALPPMEIVPFSANFAGAALSIFGLGLIALDGLFAAAALVITLATIGTVAFTLL